jgi:hypothetical protein
MGLNDVPGSCRQRDGTSAERTLQSLHDCLLQMTVGILGEMLLYQLLDTAVQFLLYKLEVLLGRVIPSLHEGSNVSLYHHIWELVRKLSRSGTGKIEVKTECDCEDENPRLRVRRVHYILNKHSFIRVTMPIIFFGFLIGKKLKRRRGRRSPNVERALQRSEVGCRLTDRLLKLNARLSNSLYETILVWGPANKLLNGANKGAYEFHDLRHRLGRWWARKSEDVAVRLVEEPIDLLL